eukprot:29949-Chlamydomonas_euryale.AAC.1
MQWWCASGPVDREDNVHAADRSLRQARRAASRDDVEPASGDAGEKVASALAGPAVGAGSRGTASAETRGAGRRRPGGCPRTVR